MDEKERKLVDEIAKQIGVACCYRMTPVRESMLRNHAIVALEVAEPVIREQVELEFRAKNVLIYGTSHPEIYKTAEDDLREENARLREVLKPFVAENIQAFAHAQDSDKCFVRCVVTFGDMRAAAAAIREGEPRNKKEDQSL